MLHCLKQCDDSGSVLEQSKPQTINMEFNHYQYGIHQDSAKLATTFK